MLKWDIMSAAICSLFSGWMWKQSCAQISQWTHNNLTSLVWVKGNIHL